MSDKPAVDTAIAEAKNAGYGTIDFEGSEYTITGKPNALLLSEMARTSSGDPEAMGVFADFFEITLGSDYPRFRKAMYRSENGDDAMLEVLQAIMEKTVGRPTE